MNVATQRHRAQQLLLRKATIEQLVALWPTLDWARLDATYPALAVQVAALVQRNRQTSTGLTVAYVRALARTAGVAAPDITLADPLNVDQFQATLHSTSVATAKKAASNGIAGDVAMKNALTLTQGAMARLVLDGGRETAMATMAADNRIVGYRRILGGGGCDFCRELAGRVYHRDNADFQAHGHCACSSELVFA